MRALPSGRTLCAIRLEHAARTNALNPELLASLSDALDAATDEGAMFIHLSAAGRHFSTGGDVGRFFQAHQAGMLDAYARDVVGRLQDLVARLLRLPAIVVTSAQGAITGGSAGLVFACDLVLLSEDAFIQPYYREVGFAPDGGWCALLPELIGPRRSLALQLTNRPVTAAQALDLGLAQQVVVTDKLEEAAQALLAGLDALPDADALVTAKRLTWDEARISRLEGRLNDEAEAFYERIGLERTVASMAAFIGAEEVADV